MAALNALYRDVWYVIPLLTLVSPVAYPSSLVLERWRWVYGLNPVVGVIDRLRSAFTGRRETPGLILLTSAAAVAVVFIGGLFFFNLMETSVAEMHQSSVKSLAFHAPSLIW